MTEIRAVGWAADAGAVEILDQTLLPGEERRIRLETVDAAIEAIRALRVRGAPAIGIAAALAYALDASKAARRDPSAFRRRLETTHARLAAARPTAVNLRWALDRVRAVADAMPGAEPGPVACRMWGEATAILEEDRAMCRAIGEHALGLLPEPVARVLTHCNAGALATAGIGTALAPLYVARERGRVMHVFADETRPLLQGSRLTAWELSRAGIDVTLIIDSVAPTLMREGRVDLVIVGADRIAANGDVANKVGTYALAVAARHHGVPFYVAAPRSTIDAEAADGGAIPIELRDADEVRGGAGHRTAPEHVQVHTPAFDITPAALIDAIVTDVGVLRPPYGPALAAALAAGVARKASVEGAPA
jgi:methylthioribose-1-phosphate isomerase